MNQRLLINSVHLSLLPLLNLIKSPLIRIITLTLFIMCASTANADDSFDAKTKATQNNTKTLPKLWQQLSGREKRYLKQHPFISVQNESDYPPFNYRDKNQPQGFSIDYMRLLGQTLGIEVKFVSGHNWAEFTQMMHTGKLDLLVNSLISEERKEDRLFSNAYAHSNVVIVTLKDKQNQFASLDKLNGHTVSVVKGYWSQQILTKNYPGIKQKVVANSLEAIMLVAKGEVQGTFFDNAPANYIIEQNQLSNLTTTLITKEPLFEGGDLYIATNKNNSILLSLINKAMSFLTEQQLIAIRSKWFSNQLQQVNISPTIDLNLNDAQRHYLAQHPVLKVQNERSYAPFNFQDKGRPAGYSVDVIKVIAQRLGLRVEFVQHKNWSTYVEMLKNRQLDAMMNIVQTKQRNEFATFTSPYINLTRNVITRADEADIITSRQSITNKRVVITKGFADNTIIRTLLPDVDLVVVQNTEQALKMVSSSQADILFGNGIIANYYIDKSFITGLKINPEPKHLEFPEQPFRIAVHKDNPLLAGLLQQSLDSLDEPTLIQLRKKWTISNNDGLPEVNLTEKERNYLTTKGLLRVSSGVEYPPYTFSEGGKEKGFTIDLINYMAQIIKVELQYIHGTWPDHMKAVENETIDLLLDAANTPQRRKRFRFTRPYVKNNLAIAMRNNEQKIPLDYDQLRGRKVAVISGWANAYHFEKHSKNFQLITVDTPNEAILAVSKGTADAYIGATMLTQFLIEKQGINNLQVVSLTNTPMDSQSATSFAIAKDNLLLQSILNKALLSVPEAKFIELRRRWFGKLYLEKKSMMHLSPQQDQWLAQHNQASVYLPDIGLPLGQYTSHGYAGIIADFIRYFDDILTTRWLEQDDNFSHLNVNQQLEADITIGNVHSQHLQQRFSFSQPLINMQIVVLTGNKARLYIDELADLKGIKTGIIREASYLPQVQTSYPNLALQQFNTMAEAILAVNSGDVELLLCPLAHCSFLTNELGANNVKIVGQTSLYHSLSLAIRKDWPILLAIVNEALSSITPQQRNRIYQQWNTRSEVLVKTDYSLFRYLLVAALLLGIAVVIWNRNIAKYAAATQKYATETQAYADSVNIAHEELKKTQSKLVQSEKMASLGTLTAGVAHEINNPTNFVHVGVHNLETDLREACQFIYDLAGEDTEQAVLDSFKLHFDPLFAHIDTIKSGTERIKTIVQDLRSFSRMDDNDKKAADIRECIRSTVNLVRTKSLHVTEIITNFEAIPAVYCHPAQLNQVFMNLIVNSCDAIEEKQGQQGNKLLGKIIIGCRMLDTDVEISVQDNGIGMSDATINKMFEPFFTTKQVGEGTGLGMAISFGIIEEHGGLISVESNEGNGSLITVRLPVLPEVNIN